MKEPFIKVSLDRASSLGVEKIHFFCFVHKQINPEHTIPTIDDDGKIIWDSHAICTYLIDKYAPNDALYPKDLYLRAKCNQRLHFDSSILFRRLYDCGWLVIRCGASEMPSDKIDAIHQAFEILEKFVTNDSYLVGNVLTVSDICAAVTVTSLEAFVEVDTKKYPHIVAWLNRVRKFGSYKAINGTMEKVYVEFLRSKMLANKQK